MGKIDRRPRHAQNTPPRFRPQRRRLSHLVPKPRPRPHRRRRRHRCPHLGPPLHHFAAVTASGNRPRLQMDRRAANKDRRHARMANRTTHPGPKSAGGATRPTHHPKPHTRRRRAFSGRMVQPAMVPNPDRMAASSRQRRRRRLKMGPPNGNGRIFRNDPARMLVCVLTDARATRHRNQRPERPNKI